MTNKIILNLQSTIYNVPRPSYSTSQSSSSNHARNLHAMILTLAVFLISGLLSSHQPFQGSKMTSVSANQGSDSSAPTATSAEIVQLMFKFIAEQMEEERKLTKAHSDADRDLTDAKILTVIQCLNKKIETVTESYNSVLADLDLKIDTTSSYNEQLIYSLKSGLQDTLQNIDSDLKSFSFEL